MADTSTTFALGQQSQLSFSGAATFQGFLFTEATYVVRERLFDVSGHAITGSTAVARRVKAYLHGIRREEFILRGVLQRSGPVYALGQTSTLAISGGTDEAAASVTFSMRLTDWVLRKKWPLEDVTGSGSGRNQENIWGIPLLSLQSRGWATSTTGPGVEMQSAATVTVTPNDVGTLAFSTASGPDGVMRMQTMQVTDPLAVGGGVGTTFSGVFEGPVQYTPGSNDLAWLFIDEGNLSASTEDDPVKKTVTLDTDAETITKQALCYDVTLSWHAGRGGPVNAVVRMIVDKDDS